MSANNYDIHIFLFQKQYDVAKRNCNEALQLARKDRDDQAYEQSQNCLKVIKEMIAKEK